MAALPERLVYVDDEQDLREIVRSTIENGGYEGALATCGSGEELLARIRILQPELIILDLKMPGMSGYEFLNHLKYSVLFHDIPVIILSSIDNSKERIKCLESGDRVVRLVVRVKRRG